LVKISRIKFSASLSTNKNSRSGSIQKVTGLNSFYSASPSYAEHCISYDRLCLSDRPSHSGIMPKRLQLRSCGYDGG